MVHTDNGILLSNKKELNYQVIHTHKHGGNRYVLRSEISQFEKAHNTYFNYMTLWKRQNHKE